MKQSIFLLAIVLLVNSVVSAQVTVLENFDDYDHFTALGELGSRNLVNGWRSFNTALPEARVIREAVGGRNRWATGTTSGLRQIYCDDRAGDFSDISSDGVVGTIDLVFSSKMVYNHYHSGQRNVAVGFVKDTNGYLNALYTQSEFSFFFGAHEGYYYIRPAGWGAIVYGVPVVTTGANMTAKLDLSIHIDLDANNGEGASWLYDGSIKVVGGENGVSLSLSSGPILTELNGIAIIVKGHSSWDYRATVDSITMGTEPYVFGWFDAINYWIDHPSLIANAGSNFIMAYVWDNDNVVQAFLNTVEPLGLRVMLQVPQGFVQSEDITGIENFINKFDSNPSVVGWYLWDEPTYQPVSVSTLQLGYDTIKEISTKPIYVVFSGTGVMDDLPLDYAGTYDVLMFDNYPCEQYFAEFNGFPDDVIPFIDGWLTKFNTARAQADQVGVPLFNVNQGYGKSSTLFGNDARLPTLNESRFLAFYPVVRGCIGQAWWGWWMLEATPALSNEPYPYKGQNTHYYLCE